MMDMKLKKWYELLLVVVIVILINILAQYFNFSYDLTSDKRFTIADSTLELVDKYEDPVYIQVLLGEDLPAGFKRLRSSTLDLLKELHDRNPNIIYELYDPNDGSPEETKKKQKQLIDEGILPTKLQYFDGKEYSQKLIFPYAILSYGTRKLVINLLEEQQLNQDEEIVLNNSVSLLEYKFANGFQKLSFERRLKIAFTEGNGEIDRPNLMGLERELSRYYSISRINLDTFVSIDSSFELLVIAGPRTKFDQKNLFKIDQYLMYGGKILWLIDKLNPDLDSINRNKFFIPPDIDSGVDELLFKYGARIEPNIVMDLESSSIPQVVGMQGDQPQLQMFKWFYHPLVSSKGENPIVKNIDRVNMYFPASIDTILTESIVKKTPLLQSSKYSKLQYNPMRLSFEILKFQPDPSKFNKSNVTLALLLEGNFESAYKNRVSAEMKSTLEQLGVPFREVSPDTKQIVVGESDFAKSMVSEQRELGYNMWDKQYYKGNKDFLLNAVEYLLDEDGILASRSKELKLRLLDTVRTTKEKTKWQLINIVVPIVILLVFGLIFNYLRRRKYA